MKEPAYEVVLLIAFSSNEVSGEPVPMHRLTRVFVARIHRIWTQIKTQIIIKISSQDGCAILGI